MNTSPSVMPLLIFLGVIVLIPLALWAMRRAGMGGAAPSTGVLRAVAHMGLGTSQRVAVVEVTVGAQRHWLVLGITAEQVTQLASYPAPDVDPSPAAPAHAAAVNQLISRWRGVMGPQDGRNDG